MHVNWRPTWTLKITNHAFRQQTLILYTNPTRRRLPLFCFFPSLLDLAHRGKSQFPSPEKRQIPCTSSIYSKIKGTNSCNRFSRIQQNNNCEILTWEKKNFHPGRSQKKRKETEHQTRFLFPTQLIPIKIHRFQSETVITHNCFIWIL